MGSKNRHAKELLPIILADRRDGQWYVEPFVGGANMIDKVDGLRWGNDYHPHLIAMWKAISGGWLPPEFVSEEMYLELKEKNGINPVTGYVGFSLSFGGKFWGGYRRDVAGKKGCLDNMETQSRRAYQSMLKQAKMLKGVKFTNLSYDEMYIPANSIIYCDPPYAKTTGYKTGEFDHAKFWQWCRYKVEEGHQVFVSEYNAPEDFVSVWAKKVNNTLAKDTGSKQGIERLFVHRSQL